LEISNRELEEERNTMKENYVNSKKRIDALQKKITEMENERVSKSGVFDFFINSKTKEENAKIKNEIQCLQDDLEVKIAENEKLHMDIFDLRNHYENMNENLSSAIKNLKNTLEEKNRSLEISNDKNEGLQKAVETLEMLNRSIQEKHRKLEIEYESGQKEWKAGKEKFVFEINEKNKLITNTLPVNDYHNGENALSLNDNFFDSHTNVKDYIINF
jgi:hypothetical protein